MAEACCARWELSKSHSHVLCSLSALKRTGQADSHFCTGVEPAERKQLDEIVGVRSVDESDDQFGVLRFTGVLIILHILCP